MFIPLAIEASIVAVFDNKSRPKKVAVEYTIRLSYKDVYNLMGKRPMMS